MFGSGGGGARLLFNHAGDRIVAADDWARRCESGMSPRAGNCFPRRTPRSQRTCRFSSDDRRLAGGLDGEQLSIWKVADGREYATLSRQLMPATESYSHAAVHPDGQLLAVAMTDGVGFWDMNTGEELRFFAAGRVGQPDVRARRRERPLAGGAQRCAAVLDSASRSRGAGPGRLRHWPAATAPRYPRHRPGPLP